MTLPAGPEEVRVREWRYSVEYDGIFTAPGIRHFLENEEAVAEHNALRSAYVALRARVEEMESAASDDGVKAVYWPGILLIIARDGSATYSIRANNPNNQYATGGVEFELPGPLKTALSRLAKLEQERGRGEG